MIFQQFTNVNAWIVSNFKGGVIPPAFQAFFNTQDAWTRANVKSNTSALWAGVGAIVAQFDGLVAGYASVAPKDAPMDVWAFQKINAVGDFLDLIPALTPAAAPDFTKMTKAEVMAKVRATSHCSALTKVNADLTVGNRSIWRKRGRVCVCV